MSASLPPPAAITASALASQASPRLHGRLLLLVRIGWVTVTMTIVVLNIIALPEAYAAQFTPQVMQDLHRLGLSPTLYGVIEMGESVLYELTYLALALLLFWRRSDERMALFCALMLVTFGLAATGGALYDISSGSVPAVLAANAVVRGVVLVLVGFGQASIYIFCYLFPSGQFVPRWTRWCALLWAAFWLAVVFFPALPAGPGGVLLPIFGLTAVIAQVYRYRRVSTPRERQQTKWVVFGFALAILIFVAFVATGFLLPPDLKSSPVLGSLIPGSIVTLGLLMVPIFIAIAILRSQLWDIDIIINRALVYGALTASVVGIYVLVVGYLGALFRTEGNLAISLLATGLVAVLFQPLRGWFQRGVNRLMYGQRDEPYAVIARLGRRLESTLAPEAVLPAIVETLAQALKLPYAAIALKQDEDFEIAAIYGSPVEGLLTLPLTYQAEPIGKLLLGPRQRGETFTAADQRLLDDLARQVGIAAHAVRLTADLQRSRERLVTAREEERRRLRRDLHDGLGPTLAALALKATTVSDLIPTNPAAATRMSNELYADIRATVGDIRRLVYELRPPRLDELGLVGAIREAARQQSLPGSLQITVEAPERLPMLPAAVEVAAYRIAQEALTNVTRHAQAKTCTVRIVLAGALQVELLDDGIGLPVEHYSGVGLISMRERAAELGGSCVVEPNNGGGTRVCARLPISSLP